MPPAPLPPPPFPIPTHPGQLPNPAPLCMAHSAKSSRHRLAQKQHVQHWSVRNWTDDGALEVNSSFSFRLLPVKGYGLAQLGILQGLAPGEM